MSYTLPFFSLFISILLGVIVTKRLSIVIPKFSEIFFMLPLGFVLFTAINYFFALAFSFPKGIIIAQISILVIELFYIFYSKINLNFLPYFYKIYEEKLLFIPLILIGILLFILFYHHILLPVNGNLYTGESTYGDLPFHLSTISRIAYGEKFPPDHPMYANTPLVYPFFINFFSAILVYEGLSLRLSIVIPGLMLSLSLVGLIYDLAFTLTKNSLKSFLTVTLYFFNGGLGFYFFLRDYSFNLTNIFQALSNPQQIKEYSHLFEQNIQWGNFLSRMIVPERALLFGLPIGIIILRLLFFRGNNNKLNFFNLALISFLLSLMPMLHTHTVLVMAIILPILALFFFKKGIKTYLLVAVLAIFFAIPYASLFLNNLDQANNFIRFHFGWMKTQSESLVWFWFKNTFLLIPLSLIALFLHGIVNRQIKILQICALILLVIINLVLFSPYDWDNVKFLFWIGLFFDIAAASVFGFLLAKRNLLIKSLTIFLIITMILSALLSIWREINVSYLLFSKEAVKIGNQVKQKTPKDAIFLTYKIHNSPISNLAGRRIMMGYPGLLWVHGIDYSKRENDINKIFQGSKEAPDLIRKYQISFVVLENYQPEGLVINKDFFNNYPILLKSGNYIIYQMQ